MTIVSKQPDIFTKESELPQFNLGEMIMKKPASERQAGGKHYKDMVIQPKYFCQVNRLNAMETDVIKYVCRHNKETGKEGGALDIKKAIHMLEYLLEVEYNEEVLK